jgi:hypothetical protein
MFRLVLIACALLLPLSCSPGMPPAGSQFRPHNDAAMLPPGAPYGVWNMARKDGGNADDGKAADDKADYQEQVQALEALGYLAGTADAPADTGVRVNLPGAQQGLNFYTSGHAPAAFLVDMEGKLLHEWRHALKDIWPEYPLRADSPKTGYWRRALPLPDGSCLAIFEGIGIIKVDKDSKLLWARQNGAHHDLHVLENGDIWVLTRKAHQVEDINSRFPTLEDFATLLDADGNEKQSISLLEAARRSGEIGRAIWAAMQPDGDVMHSNSIRWMDGGIADKHPAFKQGTLLISMLFPNTVALLDPASGRFTLALTGTWKRQHHATILSNGNMMIYDNRSTSGRSAITEVNPSTGEVLWEFRGNEETPFYSYSCGAWQELENGSFLITESDYGRAFEITRDGEVLWEFVNPHTAGENGEYIATLFELLRVPASYAGALAPAGETAP